MTKSRTSRALRIPLAIAGVVAVAAVAGIVLGDAATERPGSATTQYRTVQSAATTAGDDAETDAAPEDSPMDAVPQIEPKDSVPEAAWDDAAPKAGVSDGAVADSDESFTWGVACDQDVTGKRTGCRVTQTVAARETGKRLITVTVRRPADGGDPALMVTLPLRTFLTPGTFIQVDDQPGRKTPFQLCDVNGCYAGTPADEGFVAALKQGTTLAIEFYDVERQKTRIELPLENFAESFDKAGASDAAATRK